MPVCTDTYNIRLRRVSEPNRRQKGVTKSSEKKGGCWDNFGSENYATLQEVTCPVLPCLVHWNIPSCSCSNFDQLGRDWKLDDRKQRETFVAFKGGNLLRLLFLVGSFLMRRQRLASLLYHMQIHVWQAWIRVRKISNMVCMTWNISGQDKEEEVVHVKVLIWPQVRLLNEGQGCP